MFHLMHGPVNDIAAGAQATGGKRKSTRWCGEWQEWRVGVGEILGGEDQREGCDWPVSRMGPSQANYFWVTPLWAVANHTEQPIVFSCHTVWCMEFGANTQRACKGCCSKEASSLLSHFFLHTTHIPMPWAGRHSRLAGSGSPVGGADWHPLKAWYLGLPLPPFLCLNIATGKYGIKMGCNLPASALINPHYPEHNVPQAERCCRKVLPRKKGGWAFNILGNKIFRAILAP